MVVSARGKSVDVSPITPLVARIVLSCHPEQVWLFGSRARGQARPDSDWDLLVVMADETDESQLHPRVAWQLRKGAEVPAEVVLCWARECRDDRGTPNTLAYEVDRDGVLLHER